jgi:maltose O-acetyltransferase
MDEFLDVTRIGRVTIHESCHIGTRAVILPGVEIGPRTIVGAGSVVSRDLPPDSVCVGTPARRICSLDEYLQKHRRRAGMRPTFDYFHFDIGAITPERRKRMYDAAADGVVYMTGGRTAQLDGTGAAPRTAEPMREPIRGRAARQPT